MRHATGHPAERLEPLGVAQPDLKPVFRCLRYLAFGDLFAELLERRDQADTHRLQISGQVVDLFQPSIANEARRVRFEQKLKWISENDKNSANLRRHERFEPKENNSHITMPDGRMYKTEVIDISVGGAAIKIDIMPNLGTYVMLGKMRGRVVRYIEEGIAIEFVRPLTQQNLKSNIA